MIKLRSYYPLLSRALSFRKLSPARKFIFSPLLLFAHSLSVPLIHVSSSLRDRYIDRPPDRMETEPEPSASDETLALTCIISRSILTRLCRLEQLGNCTFFLCFNYLYFARSTCTVSREPSLESPFESSPRVQLIRYIL